MIAKHLNARGQGIVDYDYKNDILYFVVKGREYVKSLEFDDFVVDVDTEGFIYGVEIFDASVVFRMSKEALRNIRHWEFHNKCDNNIVTVGLVFVAMRRNKSTIERGQNLTCRSDTKLPDSSAECVVVPHVRASVTNKSSTSRSVEGSRSPRRL
mgnify:CR=1 FL=1